MIKKLRNAAFNLGLMMQRSKIGQAVEQETNPIVHRKRQFAEHIGEPMFGLKQAEAFLQAYKDGNFEEAIEDWRKDVEEAGAQENEQPNYSDLDLSDREMAQVRFREGDTGPMSDVHKELKDELAKQPPPPVSEPMDPEVYKTTTEWFHDAIKGSEPHNHDGVPCSIGCPGHVTEPCECGRQWPCADLLSDDEDPTTLIKDYKKAIDQDLNEAQEAADLKSIRNMVEFEGSYSDQVEVKRDLDAKRKEASHRTLNDITMDEWSRSSRKMQKQEDKPSLVDLLQEINDVCNEKEDTDA